MYGLNVPVPARVARLAVGLAGECRGTQVRERHSLLLKRLGQAPAARRLRAALADADAAPFPVRTAGIGCFDDPVSGAGPVAYLAVESSELCRLHRHLCVAFDPVAGLEGDDYVPHVTVARGGDAARLLGAEPAPREWVVDRLELRGAHGGDVESIALPA